MSAPRLLTGRVVIATHNPGKLAEMCELLAPFGVEAVSAGELGLPEPDETGTMFSENAGIKAHAAAEASGLPAFADDSGLCVDALDGAPGLFSARWAGPGKDFAGAMARVREEVERRGAPSRRAHFVSALVIAWPDGHTELFEEISSEEKHGVDWRSGAALSHRARAFVLLAAACLRRPG